MRLSRAEAKDYILNHPEYHLQRDKSGKGFVCTLCGNGTGNDGDGLLLNKKDKAHTHYKCFKCGFYGDMIELIAQEQGLDGNSPEAFEAARAEYKIELIPDEEAADKVTRDADQAQPVKNEDIPDNLAEALMDNVREMDERERIDRETKIYAHKVHNTLEHGREYFEWRGISMTTAAKMFMGYDTERNAVVIPTRIDNDLGYIYRYTNPSMKMRYQNAEGLRVGLFNFNAIKRGLLVFVTEGAFDALSLIELEHDAVALNSVSNVDMFLGVIERRKANNEHIPEKIMISLDNDEAGEQASDKLYEGLKKLGVPCEVVNVAEGYKDINEALMSNREGLRAALNRAIIPDAAELIDAHKVGSLMAGFKAYVQDSDNNHSIPTGFRCFDKAIGGGLFPKLYVIGAASSLGKTTFTLQIADQIAESGGDCIIFSLEMGKEDIIGRSISRHTYLEAMRCNNERLAKTELGITSYERYHNYSDEEKAVIAEAYKQYTDYAAERISIYEGKHTAAQIRAIIEDYIKFTGRKPVVIVDYLQIVQPSDATKKATVREQVDANIDAFLAIRREIKIPVILISSFNRGSYNNVADMSAFKESGGIEYNADCVATLELDVQRNDKAGATGGSTNKAKTDTLEAMRGVGNIREIKLTLHKNRGNKVGSVIYYLYDARFNYFKEDESKQAIL